MDVDQGRVITVLLVDGFLFKGFLRDVDIVKALAAQGHRVIDVPYNNKLATEPNIAGAARQCHDAGEAADGPVVFVGVSMGAQVLCRLLRDLGPVRLGNWRFILLANPEHAYTGRVRAPAYGGLGVPADTAYDVTDLAAQFDYWADAPTGSLNWLAQMYLSMIGNSVHTTGYFRADPDLPYPCVRQGNIRHMWKRTDGVWGAGMFDRAYRRPVTV